MRITGPVAAIQYKKHHKTRWIEERDSIIAELLEAGYVEWDSATDKFYPTDAEDRELAIKARRSGKINKDEVLDS